MAAAAARAARMITTPEGVDFNRRVREKEMAYLPLEAKYAQYLHTSVAELKQMRRLGTFTEEEYSELRQIRRRVKNRIYARKSKAIRRSEGVARRRPVARMSVRSSASRSKQQSTRMLTEDAPAKAENDDDGGDDDNDDDDNVDRDDEDEDAGESEERMMAGVVGGVHRQQLQDPQVMRVHVPA